MDNNKLKHTPGPWVMFDDCISFVIAKEDDTKYKYKRIGMFFNDTETRDENLANQRLVMCAPEMLEMLLPKFFKVSFDHIENIVLKIPYEDYKNLIEKVTDKKIDEVFK